MDMDFMQDMTDMDRECKCLDCGHIAMLSVCDEAADHRESERLICPECYGHVRVMGVKSKEDSSD